MAKKIKLPFKEQISGIINKLVNIDQNSSDSIFLHYYHGSWEASLYVGGYEASKESIDLIGDDFVRMNDESRKAAYTKALEYIKKNEGKSICLSNLKTGDKVYFDNKKAIVGTISEGCTDFSIVDTGETRTLLGFDRDETFFKTW